MGYNTDFYGELKFTSPVTKAQIVELNKLLGADIRDHKDWVAFIEKDKAFTRKDLTWINLEFSLDTEGLCWDCGEKTYDMEDKILFIIKWMRRKWPKFGLKGELMARGDEEGDNWLLRVNGDKVRILSLVLSVPMIKCPHCKEYVDVEIASRYLISVV